MSALTDIWNTIHGIVTTADTITLVFAVVVVLAAGFAMSSFQSIISATVLSLIVFALLCFGRAVTVGGHEPVAYITTDWHTFLELRMLTLVAYAVLFAVLIAIVNFVRSAVSR